MKKNDERKEIVDDVINLFYEAADEETFFDQYKDDPSFKEQLEEINCKAGYHNYIYLDQVGDCIIYFDICDGSYCITVDLNTDINSIIKKCRNELKKVGFSDEGCMMRSDYIMSGNQLHLLWWDAHSVLSWLDFNEEED